jgi:hypothetical protein
MTIPPQTEIEKKRAAWWAERHKPGMSRDEVFRLNEELITLYPQTDEEREQKWREMKDMPEFVL